MYKKLLPALGCCMLATFAQHTASAQIKGPSSSQTAYVVPARTGVQTTAILTTPDLVNGYKMCGTPDGLGAFDNGDGTFTLVMNHEFGNTAGVVRAHGSKGAFVSKWIIRKSDLSVVSGTDLMQKLKLWNGTGYTTYDMTTPYAAGLGRFCSADLAPVSAFYNSSTGKGTQERIFLNGEESGNEGRGFAHIVTGPNAGVSYELPYIGKLSFENSLANPATGDKTVVASTDDATPGQVYFYIGTKTNSGTEIEKAGLSNGSLYSPSVTGMLMETGGSTPAANTTFTMINLGDVHNMSGSTLNTNSNNSGVTTFLRPEDGAWDPSHPEDFYFVTTNGFNSPSRLWKLHFSNLNDLTQGGTITAVLNGTEGQQMLDNITIDHWGHILMVEDVGNNAHNGKMWQYTIATDELVVIGKHDVARFGDIGIPATAPYNQDEEASGIIDVQEILGAGKFLFVDQTHYSLGGDAVEGGQLLLLYNPDTYNACAAFTGNINLSPSPAVTGQAENTIYLGYGPQSVTLTASVSDVAGQYTYSWAPGGATTASISVSPTTTTEYTVTITNAAGCSNTVKKTVNVVDIRDGSKNKVFICHNGHTLSVSVNAVPDHLSHGDLLGNCATEGTDAKSKAIVDEAAAPTLYPNPAANKAFISLSLTKDEQVNISVVDVEGRVVMASVQKSLKAGKQQIDLNTSQLSKGSYFVVVNHGETTSKIKMIILR
ncbi:MAG TPA: T9SS type A sorting domain-containing protein [Chitinophagaceae bacterium]